MTSSGPRVACRGRDLNRPGPRLGAMLTGFVCRLEQPIAPCRHAIDCQNHCCTNPLRSVRTAAEPRVLLGRLWTDRSCPEALPAQVRPDREGTGRRPFAKARRCANSVVPTHPRLRTANRCCAIRQSPHDAWQRKSGHTDAVNWGRPGSDVRSEFFGQVPETVMACRHLMQVHPAR